MPAPETAHAVWGAMAEALACKETGESKTIVFNLSGHGHFDLASYDAYLAGNLEDYAYPEEQIQASLNKLCRRSSNGRDTKWSRVRGRTCPTFYVGPFGTVHMSLSSWACF